MKTVRPSFLLATSISALLVSLLPARAVNFTWTAGTGDWAAPENWDNGTPGGGGGNFVYINNGGTANITSTTNAIQDPFIGRGLGSEGHVNQTAGDHVNSGWAFIGTAGGTGTWDLSGSTSLSTGRIYLGGQRDTADGGTGTMTVNTTGTVTATSDLSLGTNGGNGTLNVNSGSVLANSWMIIGETQAGRGGSTGTVNQTGGVVTNGATDSNGRLWLGSNEGNSAGDASTGTYNLFDGTLNARGVSIGKNYTGIFNQSGGIANITQGGEDTTIGNASGATGSYNLSGGTLNAVGNFQIGATGSGTLAMTGGTINSSGWFVVGRYAGGVGDMTVSAGTVTHNDNATSMIIAEQGTGTLTISGTGTVNANSDQGLRIGHAAGANGTINVNAGGTLGAKFIQKTDGGSIAKINLDGGTLKAAGNSGNFFLNLNSADIEVMTGGVTFDSNTFNSTITQSLDGAGGITKVGNGTLALGSNFSNYAGPTTITGGTLSVAEVADGGGASSLGASSTAATNLVFNGGTLRYTGTTATLNRDFTINAGKTAIIDVTTAGETLTLTGGSAPSNGALTKIGNGTLSLAGANSHTGLTSVNGGVLAASGVQGGGFAVNNGGHLTALHLAEGSLTVPTLTLGAGSAVDFEFGAGNDVITISNANGLTLGSTGLFLYQSGGTSPFTTNGTYTLFDYTTAFTGALNTSFSIANSQVGKVYGLTNNVGATTIELTIADALSTAWANVGGGSWSTAGNWTAGVPNAIGAIATFGAVIGGPSTVTVSGPKTAGVIVLDSPNPYTLAGGASDTITLSNGFGTPLISQVSGDHFIAAPLIINAPSTQAAVASGTTLTISGNISGSGELALTDSGTVVLTGTNSYAGTVVNSGALNVGNGGTTGTLGSGPVALNGASTLTFNRSNSFSLANNTSGTGSVIHNGAGTLTYTGVASHTGTTTLNGVFINEGSINGTSGIDIESTTTLRLGSSTSAQGPITVANNDITTASLLVQGTATASTTSTASVAAGSDSVGTLSVSDSGSFSAAGTVTVASGFNSTGTVNVSGSGVFNAGTATFGAGGTGTLNISGGTMTTNRTNIGGNTAGTMTISAGTHTSAQFYVGDGGPGVLNMTGGTINANQWTVVGFAGGNTGDIVMSGGTLNQNHTDFLTVGENGTGTLTMTGNSVLNDTAAVDTSNRGTNKGNIIVGRNSGGVGTWTISDNAVAHIRELRVGGGAGSTGTVNIDGNSFVDSSYDLHFGQDGAGTVNINGGTLNTTSGWIQIGMGGSGTGTLNVTAGSISAREYRVGLDGTAIVDVSGGTLTATQQVTAGINATGNGSITVRDAGVANFNNGAVIGGVGTGSITISSGGTLNDTGNFIIGNGGTTVGQGTINGGTMNVNGELWVGQAAGGQGTLDVSSGTVNVNNWLAVGREGASGTVNLSGSGVINKTGVNHTIVGSLSGVGTVNQTGGQFNSSPTSTAGGAGGIRLGENGGGIGTWTISGGTASADFISVGWVGGGTGILNISGTGLVTADNNVVIGEGGTGTVNLDGGTLRTTIVNAGGGAPQLNFNGGILQALGDSADFIQGFTSGNLAILTGGAKIDTNGFSVVVNSPLQGIGDLTKLGEGTLTLTGAQDYPTLNTEAGRTDLSAILGIGTSTINADADLNTNFSQTLAALNIGAGAVVTLGDLPPPAPALGEAIFEQEGLEAVAPVGQAVPEPGSAVLILSGIASLLGLRRRRA